MTLGNFQSQRRSEIMGKGGRAPAKPAAEKREGKFVPKYEYFAKAKLASYPNEDGGCLHLEKGQDEKKFFDLGSIVKSRSGGNEELCRRMGMGVALDAASAACGIAVLNKHFSGEWPEEVVNLLRKSGLPKIKAALSTEKGQAFASAVEVLNVGKEGQPPEEDIKRAMKTFVTYLQDDPDQLWVSLARLAADASCLYVWAMTLLKDMALLQHPKEWAKKIEGKQTEVVKAWMRRPMDVEKLRKALVSELMTKVKSHKPSKGQKRKASDSSDSGAGVSQPDSSEGPHGSSSAEVESDLADSKSSDSEEKAKKSKDKTKKDKKEKEKEKAKQKAKKEQEKRKKAEKAAKKKKDEKKKAPEITLSPEEATSESEEVKEVYAGWAQKERSRFAHDVAEAELAHMSEKKAEKLTLAALVSVIDNLPAEVLKHHNLEKLLSKLKEMQKLPKKEKVQEIFGALNTIVLASGAVAEENEKAEEKDEKPEEVEEKPADTAEAPGDDEMHE